MNRKPSPLFVLLLAMLLNCMGVCGQIITTFAGDGVNASSSAAGEPGCEGVMAQLQNGSMTQ